MFGYVNILKPELKVREYEEYRAVYCGLCKKLGKEFGWLSRLTLNYDFTFLALLGLSVSGDAQGMCSGFCPVHPLQKCSYYSDDSVKYSAFASIILTYAKLSDDIRDERGGKRLRARLLSFLYRSAYKKAKKRYPQLALTVNTALSRLSAAEKKEVLSLDAYADHFASILREIFSGLASDSKQAQVLGEIGYHTGRWIYILDAFDDAEEDAKRRRFNPLFIHYSKKINESSLEFKQRIRLDIEMTLTDSLVRVSKAYELLDSQSRWKGQIVNIVYLGMPQRQKTLLRATATV